LIRRVRIKIQYDNGSETIIDTKGPLDQQKLLVLMDQLRTALLAQPSPEDKQETLVEEETKVTRVTDQTTTIYKRVKDVIHRYLLDSYFTSLKVKYVYEEAYNEKIKLSTVSTYLSRLFDEGELERVKHGRRWVYQLARKKESVIKRQTT
jgi:hypothetical protein